MNPELQMFIPVCCERCRSETCEGALTDKNFENSCEQWKIWHSLPKHRQCQLFLKSMTEVLNLLEELT